MLGERLASWRPSLLAGWEPGPPWWSWSGRSSRLPIRALRMMSSRPRLLAGSLNEWFLALRLPAGRHGNHTEGEREAGERAGLSSRGSLSFWWFS